MQTYYEENMLAGVLFGASVGRNPRIFTTTIITHSLFVYVTPTAPHQDQHLINNLLKHIIPLN